VIRPPTWQPGVGAFATLMLAGDMVKLAFLKVHDFEVHDTPGLVLFRFTKRYRMPRPVAGEECEFFRQRCEAALLSGAARRSWRGGAPRSPGLWPGSFTC
jgi:hypothetical protein